MLNQIQPRMAVMPTRPSVTANRTMKMSTQHQPPAPRFGAGWDIDFMKPFKVLAGLAVGATIVIGTAAYFIGKHVGNNQANPPAQTQPIDQSKDPAKK